MQRIIAVVLAVFFLGLAGLMASVTLFVRDPIPVVTARAPLAVHAGETPDSGMRASLVVDGAFRFEVQGHGLSGSDTPEVKLRRAEGAGGDDIAIEVEDLGAGSFHGRGSFTAPGRWTLVVRDGASVAEFPFVLQE